MNSRPLLIPLLLLMSLSTVYAPAQNNNQSQPCSAENSSRDIGMITTCPPLIPLPPDTFHPTTGALVDGSGLPYGNTGLITSLYGSYLNDENNPTKQKPYAHYMLGLGSTVAGQIVPRCKDGTVPTGQFCQDGEVFYPPAIVFLFLGFSNWDIEIGGGHSNIWMAPGNPQFTGQPCATKCENLNNPDGATPWEIVSGEAPDSQQSLLYQVYSPAQPLVGPHVVLFNGAYGSQTLYKWDPTSIGYYYNVTCDLTHRGQIDPECNYHRVLEDLTRNGYTEAQVQAIFLKSSNSFPQCDLQAEHCNAQYTPPTGVISAADAYQSEQYLGDIVRYLRCCILNANKQPTTTPRYPNLQQVFLTSRTYGGYAQNPPLGASDTTAGCLSPEPFAYVPVAKLG